MTTPDHTSDAAFPVDDSAGTRSPHERPEAGPDDDRSRSDRAPWDDVREPRTGRAPRTDVPEPRSDRAPWTDVPEPRTDRTPRTDVPEPRTGGGPVGPVGGGGGDLEADRVARVALTWLAEPGNRAVWGLVQDAGATATLDMLLGGDVPDTRLRALAAARSRAGDARRFAEAAMRRGAKLGARIVVPSDDEWPARVGELARLELDVGGRVNQDVRPPLCFWVRGGPPLNTTLDRSVAIVGARAASPYGVHVATDLGYGLAEQGWTVVSGGAFGIDTAAHRGALTAGGRTVAVLACGVERPYPLGNASLFEQVVENGLVVSEWPLGAEPLRHRFLVRNRVIAAATAGTVVVEAAARSGATQTMGRVLALGRPALVVPGPITSAMSVGCHAAGASVRPGRHVPGRGARRGGADRRVPDRHTAWPGPAAGQPRRGLRADSGGAAGWWVVHSGGDRRGGRARSADRAAAAVPSGVDRPRDPPGGRRGPQPGQGVALRTRDARLEISDSKPAWSETRLGQEIRQSAQTS
jgi:DNA processing protein